MKTGFALTALCALMIFGALPAEARDRHRDGGPDCREYTRTVSTKYGLRSVQGTACKTHGGTWRIVDETGNNAGRVFILRGDGFNNVVYIDSYRSGRHYTPQGNINFHDHDKWRTWHHHGYGRWN